MRAVVPHRTVSKSRSASPESVGSVVRARSARTVPAASSRVAPYAPASIRAASRPTSGSLSQRSVVTGSAPWAGPAVRRRPGTARTRSRCRVRLAASPSSVVRSQVSGRSPAAPMAASRAAVSWTSGGAGVSGCSRPVRVPLQAATVSIDHDRVAAGRQRGAPGPGQRLRQVVLDQRADQAVEDVGTGRHRVAAQRGEAAGERRGGDQVGGGDRVPASAQAGDHGPPQVVGGALGAVLPQPLVVRGRGHAGLVAGEGVELPERVRHQVAAGHRAGRRCGQRRAAGRGGRLRGQGAERGGVEAAGDDQDGGVPRLGEDGADPVRHVRLAGAVALVRRGVAADQVEVGVQALGQALGRGHLEQAVPQGVHRAGAEPLAQPVGGLGVPGLGVGVPVGAQFEGRVPGRQVDEEHLRAGRPSLPQRHPLGRVVAQRRPGGGGAFGVAVVAEHGDRQLVAEGQLVQSAVEVGRALDEYVPGPQPPDGVRHQPGAGGGVVTYPEEDRGHQPASRWRASCTACQCGPRRRGTRCSR